MEVSLVSLLMDDLLFNPSTIFAQIRNYMLV